MKDLVGAQIPTPEQMAQLMALFAQMEQILSPCVITLNPEERQAALKMRLGGEEIAHTVARLAEKHQLKLPDASIAGMEQDLLLAERLQPFTEQMAGLLQKLEDTRLEARSEAWWVTTALYSMLVRLSSSNAELAAALKPVSEFFGKGRRSRKSNEPA